MTEDKHIELYHSLTLTCCIHSRNITNLNESYAEICYYYIGYCKGFIYTIIMVNVVLNLVVY